MTQYVAKVFMNGRSQAISSGAVLVTNNQREFTGITGLICENWLVDVA